MGLVVRHGIHGALHVAYGVDELRRVVYIKAFQPNPPPTEPPGG
jgi:hypothetical protein